MMIHNEFSLTVPQLHFLHFLLDGKREIDEQEARGRKEHLKLNNLCVPCVIACISPQYLNVPVGKKDELLLQNSEYICQFLNREGHIYYCLINSYDNFEIVLPVKENNLDVNEIERLFLCLHQKFRLHFGLDLFIGVGSMAEQYCDLFRSKSEAMEMLAYKYQYADRGVIQILNTRRFKHYSRYGNDIMFERVIGQFKDGNLGAMAVRLNELIDNVRFRTGVYRDAIQRVFIELTVSILHAAANAEVDVDAALGEVDIYRWILDQDCIETMSDWLIDLSGRLLVEIKQKHKDTENEIIMQACDYIENNIGEPALSLQMVSDEVGLSSAYFSQLFKAEKGVGMVTYIRDLRIYHAKELLRNTALRSEDIAHRLGFTSATYFGRVFKKCTGVTPNVYRNKAD